MRKTILALSFGSFLLLLCCFRYHLTVLDLASGDRHYDPLAVIVRLDRWTGQVVYAALPSGVDNFDYLNGRLWNSIHFPAPPAPVSTNAADAPWMRDPVATNDGVGFIPDKTNKFIPPSPSDVFDQISPNVSTNH